MTGADKKIRIGLFDSGRGGFSILTEMLRTSDQFECYYFADLHYHPYGPKSDQEILDRSHKVVQTLLTQNVELIVVACNTATAVAIDDLRATYDVAFVGIEPFLAAYEKLTKESTASVSQSFTVLVTEAMGKSRRFNDLKKRRDPQNRINVHICYQLASLVERAFETGWTPILQQLMQQDLLELKSKKIDYVILGCTHYPLIKDRIAQYLEAKTLSPCPYVVRRVFDVLGLQLPGQQNHLARCLGSFYYTESEKEDFDLRQADSLSF